MEWLDRFVSVMDIVSDASLEGISMTEIQHETGLAKSTLHRMLTDMADQGLISQIHANKRYRMGPRPMVWGSKYLEGQDPAKLLARFCDLLSERTGLYVFLCRYDAGEIYCIYTRRPDTRRVKYFVHIGQKMPLNCSAASKAILAFQPPNEIEFLLSQQRIQRFTDHTKCKREEILQELEQVKKAGVAFCRNEMEVGVTTISTPVTFSDNEVIFSISLIGETSDIESREITLLRELLRIGQEAGKFMKVSKSLL